MCYNYISLSRGDIMPKIKIKACLENKNAKSFDTNEVMGIKVDNKIKYYDNDICTVINVLNKELILERKSQEYHIVLKFNPSKTTKGLYAIFDIGTLDLKITTNFLSITDNEIKIDYELENMGEVTNFSYFIKMEEMK